MPIGGQMLDGGNGLFASQGLQQLMKSQKDKRKNCGRACFMCRQFRVKCDYQRPCHNCVKRGQTCQTDDDTMSCAVCRKSKLKCDKQKPCSRCLKRGKADECVSQVENGVPERFRQKPAAGSNSAAGASQVLQLQNLVSWPPASAFWHTSSASSVDVVASTPFCSASSSSSSIEQEPSRKRAFVEIYNGEEEAEEAQQWVGDGKAMHVARPMIHESKKLRLMDTSKLRQEISSTFTNKIMQKMWEAGYAKNNLEQIFSILPPGLHAAIADGLRALETLAFVKAQFATLQASNPSPSASAVEQDSFIPAELVVDDVHDNLGCGFWSLSFCPETGRRTGVQVNLALAKMVQMHPEELLARAGHSDVNLPCSQLEFLCNMLDDLCNAGEARLIRYSTVTAQIRGRVQETMLVRRETSREFDSEGKCLRIQHLMTRVPEEEYDAAFRCDPSMCRPFYSVMGDFRGGADIVADATRDFLFDEQIGSMQQTAEGAKRLRRLESCLRIRFEPIVQIAQKAKMKLAAATGQRAEPPAGKSHPWSNVYAHARVGGQQPASAATVG